MRDNQRNFTDRLLKSLKPKDTRYAYYDESNPGLAFVVHPTGRKVWRYVFTVGGRQGKRDQVTIGSFPAWSLSQARTRYKTLRRLVDRGVNPAQLKRESKTTKSSEKTLNELVDDYFTSRQFKALSGEHRKAVTSAIKRDILPTLGERKGRDVADYLDYIDFSRRQIGT